jgi:hypothetical protein
MGTAELGLLAASTSDVEKQANEMPLTRCGRCGFRGPHATPAECIDALGSRVVAVLEFKTKRGGGRPNVAYGALGRQQGELK